jgi:prolyl oligopeptidase
VLCAKRRFLLRGRIGPNVHGRRLTSEYPSRNGIEFLDQFRIARLWIPEYGSADEPAAFRWLYAYSPYHHVRDGTPYPAVLLTTGESDSRVDPLHARKMAARLQAATSSAHPILLRIETRAGHGQGKPLSKTLEEWTDVWAFVFSELGLEA